MGHRGLFRTRNLGVAMLVMAMALGLGAPPRAALATPQGGFAGFVAALWPEAKAKGISRQTFEAAFAGVTPDPDVIAKTRKQAEFTKTIGQYLGSAVSEKRIDNGTDHYRQWAPWLARAEAKYGVDRYVIMGVWGLETNFGGFAGNDYVVRSLATLAYANYRGTYFRHELLAALAILEARHIDPAHMTGSWAGAMGQTQFMPSSFKSYAVDFDGDGRRDIWTSVPDAIGSTANYLHKHGWVAGETWGYEVRLPEGFAASEGTRAGFGTWAARGLRRADGGAMPDNGTGTLLMPSGRRGPVFLVTPNFRVIKSYNNSTSYALGVALLGDRIAGWGPLSTAWPVVTAQPPAPKRLAKD
ncbi:lytic murein transglycosylase [Lichenihabitans sp. Uapishka_5]|uniref:lytic murein transglycosylase n=1 Tax=Lichenihabitans sp. Uapishka_5 TaxID=3037302 RepID=UPI0029E7EBE3|nr:lytic murein transglycosylase [Lichenihabitans sp. Uapishka_5]MDX7953038.1 lytic murein transglycosylase [Lichenihabitans sp. Uapishka_5]